MASIKDVQKNIARQEDEHAVTILQPDLKPYLALDGKPATITVVGGQSERIRRWERSMRERIRASGFQPGQDDEWQDRIDFVVAAVTGWSGWDDGEREIPFSEKNLRALLESVEAVHIVNQLHYAITNHALFSSASSVN